MCNHQQCPARNLRLGENPVIPKIWVMQKCNRTLLCNHHIKLCKKFSFLALPYLYFRRQLKLKPDSLSLPACKK